MVDASQGIEAQTLANVWLAVENDLEIIPVINKIDLPAADPDRVKKEIEDLLGIDASDALLCSAKTGALRHHPCSARRILGRCCAHPVFVLIIKRGWEEVDSQVASFIVHGHLVPAHFSSCPPAFRFLAGTISTRG